MSTTTTTRPTATSPSTAVPTVGTDADTPVTTLLLAFADDPVVRWIFPDPLRYRAGFTALLGVLGDTAARSGAVDVSAEAEGAAIWLRPGAQVPLDDAAAVITATVRPERLDEVGALLETLDEQHPATPHWYLPFVGVEPHHQGRGIGSRLLRTGHDRSDATGLPAYLEASSPRNRALYGRHGYEVLSEVRVGGCPPLWRMLRSAR